MNLTKTEMDLPPSCNVESGFLSFILSVSSSLPASHFSHFSIFWGSSRVSFVRLGQDLRFMTEGLK